MDDKVNSQHPLYAETAPLRATFADVCKGTHAMRKNKTHLPQFPAETPESYQLRLDTATLLNVTAKTREALCGLVFQKDITLKNGEAEVPKDIEKLAENIDNKGNHLDVFARDLLEDSFDGWSVILVDSPSAQARDLAEQKALGIQPYWVKYCADDVINWDYRINPVSKKRELSMIVLRERTTKRVGTFVRKEVVQYRVYLLDANTVTWELFEEKKDASGKDFVSIGSGTIEKQDQIPVAVVGELGDAPPLMDLCYKNIEHYQTYSDYKGVLHKTCVPMLVTVNLDGDPTGISGDIWLKCNEGGSASYVEPAGTSIDKVETALNNIEAQMGKLGLAMLAGKPTKGDVTATETMLDSIQETSALQARAVQLKDALEQALMFTNKYLGRGDEISVELGCSWTQLVLTAQDLTTLNTLVTDGTMSLESFVYQLHVAGKLPPDVSPEDEIKRIEKEMKEMRPVINANQLPNEAAQTQGAAKPPIPNTAANGSGVPA